MVERAPPLLDPRRHALFLDFDGTLVDFALTPEAISLRPRTGALLVTLSGMLGGALAIVSGRQIADLDRYLAPPEFPAVGVHGQEFRPFPGEFRRMPPPDTLGVARQRLAALLEPDDPVRLEDKGTALVLHFRAHPEQKERARSLARDAVRGLSRLDVVSGHEIFEILGTAASKARALDLFMALPPFTGRVPVFVGDDLIDEDGIRGATELGGFGVKVGPGESSAAYRLQDVTAVHDWLARLAAKGPLARGTIGALPR